jgi:hypothetical protein
MTHALSTVHSRYPLTNCEERDGMSLQVDMLRRALKLRQCPNIAREVIKIDQPCLTVTNML